MMIPSRCLSALAAVALFASMASAASPTEGSASSSTVVSISTPSASVAANAMTDIGCFDTGIPLEDHGSYLYQSQGNCQKICLLLQKQVLGLVNGTNCFCGDYIPPKNAATKNESCDTPCSGIDTDKCGGPNKYWISLTGLSKNRVDNYVPASSSASSSTLPKATAAAPTVVVTPSTYANQSNGVNKAGIAAGVIVGVVVLAAIIAGVILYLRHKRRRDVEEEYRRQAAVNEFVGGGKAHTSNSSMTDSRLDPEFQNRRQSNGSIADNEDYSRRILKVTNA